MPQQKQLIDYWILVTGTVGLTKHYEFFLPQEEEAAQAFFKKLTDEAHCKNAELRKITVH